MARRRRTALPPRVSSVNAARAPRIRLRIRRCQPGAQELVCEANIQRSDACTILARAGQVGRGTGRRLLRQINTKDLNGRSQERHGRCIGHDNVQRQREPKAKLAKGPREKGHWPMVGAGGAQASSPPLPRHGPTRQQT